jgi:hypothetical protein
MILAVSLALLTTACGGGGGGSSASFVPGTPSSPSNPANPSNPTPIPTSAPAPTLAPPPAPTAQPVVIPNDVQNSTQPATVVRDADYNAIGQINPASSIVAARPSNATVDGIACGAESGAGQHFHIHLSIFYNGTQYAVPAAIGIYHPKNSAQPYFYEANLADPASCTLAPHTHAADGVVHIATADPKQQFNLGEVLDEWGVTLNPNSFWTFSGPTRVFKTDESSTGGSAGSHPVTEVTGIDPHAIPLINHFEYTIEVNGVVPTPNYTFESGV